MSSGRVARRPEYTQRTRYITEGNTVRVIRTETDPFYERERRRKLLMEHSRRRQAEAVKIARRQQVVSIAFPVLLILIASVSAVLYFGYGYLTLKSSVDGHLENVKKLETRLEKLKTENDALEQSIDTSVDLNYVYNVAVNKLGMVHAGAENVVMYDKTESQYVRQYEQIPEF